MNNSLDNKKKTVSQERKNEIKSIKTKEKRVAKRVIAVVLLLFVLLCVLLFALDRCEKSVHELETVTVEQVKEVYPTLNPYPADFDKDLSGYNPVIMYEGPDGNSYSISDIPDVNKNEAHRFFEKYFDVLKNGDSDSYGKLFTKSYKNNPRGFEKDFTRSFPPQELYDITVKEMLRSTDSSQKYTYEGEACFFGYYLVSYKIRKNDGFFRRDLYAEGVERPLVLELVTFNRDTPEEQTLIKNLYTESSIPIEE